MLKLSIEQIIENIEKEKCFHAEANDCSFQIKIDSYVHYISTAIHHGHRLREDLLPKMILSDYERWFEEDARTGDLISEMPITITGQDSRYEYDLNRDPDNCIYETPEQAWGKQVWKEPLSKEEKKVTLSKFHSYYKVIDALIGKLESMFGLCQVYSVHSYNYVRHKKETPVFNLGTMAVDSLLYRSAIDHFLRELSHISLPGINVTAKENDVFKGLSEHVTHITGKFSNTLVYPLEVKKIYCNEMTGDYYNDIIEALKKTFIRVFKSHAEFFSTHF